MNTQARRYGFRIAILTAFLTTFSVVRSPDAATMSRAQVPFTPGHLTATLDRVILENSYDNAPQLTAAGRVAQRLRARLRKSGSGISPPMRELKRAVRQRQSLLTHTAHVSFVTDDTKKPDEWDVSVQKYPLWLRPEFTSTSASFLLNGNAIATSLAAENIIHAQAPQYAVLNAVNWSADPKKASRVTIDGVAKSGYALNVAETTTRIAQSLVRGSGSVTVGLTFLPGRIINKSGVDMGDLALWATGRSDFKGSDNSRISNVKKALDQHVNNSAVAAGQIFSFNSTLDGRVSEGNGWRMAKVIVNGGDLVYEPGGGICQASTTLYRAALLAGLPVLERKAHSLYVLYYKKYGVGIDATIYPGSQDLSFRNDSKYPIIVQAYHEGTNAYVNIYGTPDGRVSTLDGPYFAATASKEVAKEAGGISANEIVWLHTVTYADGKTMSETVSSHYKQLPKSLITEFPAPENTVVAKGTLAMD